jgi:hypothetical protein
MQTLKATGLDRKSGGAKWRDLRSALRLSQIFLGKAVVGRFNLRDVIY